MASPPKIKLGAFAAGEIPLPLLHSFKDYDDSPVSLVGATVVQFNIESIPPVTGPIGGNAVIQDGPNGLVRYDWSATDLDEPADYTGQFWVKVGGYEFASDPILWTVYDGPGVAP